MKIVRYFWGFHNSKKIGENMKIGTHNPRMMNFIFMHESGVRNIPKIERI